MTVQRAIDLLSAALSEADTATGMLLMVAPAGDATNKVIEVSSLIADAINELDEEKNA